MYIYFFEIIAFTCTSLKPAVKTIDQMVQTTDNAWHNNASKIKKHGRPKGADKTVIGLPKKRKCSQENKPVPFLKKTPKEKEKGTLMIVFFTNLYIVISVIIA